MAGDHLPKGRDRSLSRHVGKYHDSYRFTWHPQSSLSSSLGSSVLGSPPLPPCSAPPHTVLKKKVHFVPPFSPQEPRGQEAKTFSSKHLPPVKPLLNSSPCCQSRAHTWRFLVPISCPSPAPLCFQEIPLLSPRPGQDKTKRPGHRVPCAGIDSISLSFLDTPPYLLWLRVMDNLLECLDSSIYRRSNRK